MKYTETEIEGVWLIEPRVFEDARGYFFEAWKQADFDAHVGGHVEFVQDNESMSARGVLRGLHYQKGSFSQAQCNKSTRSLFSNKTVILSSILLDLTHITTGHPQSNMQQ